MNAMIVNQEKAIAGFIAELPSYRKEWQQMAQDYLEELRPREYAELSRAENCEQLQDRIEAAAAATEGAVMSLLKSGVDFYTAREIAQEDCLKPVREPESWEQGYVREYEYIDEFEIAAVEM